MTHPTKTLKEFTVHFTHEQLGVIATQLLARYLDKRIWAFSGPLGAGKTTLIKSLCTCLGAVGNMTSPTFSMVNAYETVRGNKLYHFDFYRISNALEALDIGIEEYLNSGAYCFIEWPERLLEVLPPETLWLELEFQETTSQENTAPLADIRTLLIFQ